MRLFLIIATLFALATFLTGCDQSIGTVPSPIQTAGMNPGRYPL